MKSRVYLRLVVFVIVSVSCQVLYAQQVQGIVKDGTNDEPLVGATVVNLVTGAGAITDELGEYSIGASSGDSLEVSYVGYANKVLKLGSKTYYTIEMLESSNLLTEMLVLGYSSKTQKELSASVTTLKSDDLQTVTSSNIETMLQGQVPGLTVSSSTGAPGAAADIRIRGITSINADKPPLVVVDGMPGGGYVPNDVESITVLKDAAAIGLYGAAGSAGVIIVNTKQGTNTKPVLSLSVRTGMKEAVTGPFRMMNGQELYAAQKAMWGDKNQVSFLKNRPEDLEDISYDWMDVAFNPAYLQNYTLSARGKTESLNYGFSADYFNEEGTFINTDFERLNLRGNLKFNLNEKFSLHTDINGQFSRSSSQYYSWFEDVFWNMPWDLPYDENNEYYGPKYVTNPRNDWYGQFRRSFLYSTERNRLGSTGNSLIWSVRAKYDITPHLSVESRTRMDTYSGRYKEYFSPLTDEGIATSGYVGVDSDEGRGILSTHFLRYSKTFGRHDVGIFVAHEGGINKSISMGQYGQNLSSSSVDVLSGASVVTGRGSNITYKGISYISEATYSLDGKYLATAYFRRDGSSLFAANKRYGNFYGGSVAWLASDEAFIKDKGVFDYLKFRLSYGLTGNSNIPPFLHLATYNITRKYNNNPAGEPNNPANPNLGWETTAMANAGIDMSIFGDKLGITLDVYQKKVEGMLLDNPLPFSSGYQSRTENIGDMQNVGIEAAINYGSKSNDLTYNVGVNFAYNQNEITKVTDVLDEQTLQAGAIQQINEVGKEAFQWYMPKWLGVNPDDGSPMWEKINYDDQGNELSRESTGTYTEATFQANGSAIPKINGGVNASVGYKNFSLSALFTYQMGNKIYHYTREFVDSDGANTGINLMALHEGWNRWENPGDVATHPVLNRGGSNGAHQTSSRYIEDGDYLRFRNVTLSYSLPEAWTSKLGLGNATLSVHGDNLITWSKFSGMDPDIGLSVQAFSLPGLSYLKYPISRQFSASINIDF